jgi:membrane-associated phospholipid phosphatase
MNEFLNHLKNGKTFLITSGLFLIFSLLTFFLIGVSATPIFYKMAHPKWLNVFFINLTFMGDSFFVIMMSVFVVYYLQKIKLGLKLLLVLMIAMLLVQLLNYIVFPENYHLYIESGQYILDKQSKSLFPSTTITSSHTAVVFAWATILSIKIKQSKYQKLFFLLSVLVAFSRLYLAPHSYLHIIIGSFVGLISGILVYFIQISFVHALRKSSRLYKLNKVINHNYAEYQIR